MKISNRTYISTTDPLTEGLGECCVKAGTPALMRDCIRERYWENPSISDLHKVTGRLADDFKRRGFSQQKASEIIYARLSKNLGGIKPDSIKRITATVSWVYNKQEHALTCTGAINREGLCFRSARACRFHEADMASRRAIRAATPIVLPATVSEYLAANHPSDAIYAAWTYTELLYLEHERNLVPNDSREPIFIGFRNLAARVALRNNARGYNKHAACNSIRLLEETGFIKRVIQGKAGYMCRKANGYVRLIPISPKYNSESESVDTICVQEVVVSENNIQEEHDGKQEEIN